MSFKTMASIAALAGALALTGVACGDDNSSDSNASGAASEAGTNRVTAIPSLSGIGTSVKIDAGGLQEDTVYYYRFETRGAESPIGCTRTLPLLHARGKWRMAFASCTNNPNGFFNAYGRIAARNDNDKVLHLGD